MDFNFVSNIETCYIELPHLLYYSHISTAVIVLLISFIVYFKNKKFYINRVLLYLSLVFFLWIIFDIILWVGNDSRLIMFFWSFLGILYILVYFLSLYLFYLFVFKKDLSLRQKIFFSLLMLPIFILAPTTLNLEGFDIDYCEAYEVNYYTTYYYWLGLAFSLWILVEAVIAYKQAEKVFKRQIILMTAGVEIFLWMFFIAGYLSALLGVGNYRWELYGLFGMPIFVAFLAYLIVQYKVFNIKLIATNVLVVGLVILVASELLFIESRINFILVSVTLILVSIAGYMLVKSVKKEIKQKEELAIANEKLKELDKAKTEFISITSHQLRTPLTAVKGYISLLMEGSYGQCAVGLEDVFKKIETSNNRILTIVEDLLSISRINSGRMIFDFKKSPIDAVVKTVVGTFEIKAKNKNLELKLNLPKEQLPEIYMDEKKINEVISNLVDNAIKYTQQGSVNVFVEKISDEYILVKIADTGMGMDEEEIPKLFERFERGKAVSKVDVEGTGLGLYICKKLVDAHKGKIWAKSDGVDKGTTFFVQLPIDGAGE